MPDQITHEVLAERLGEMRTLLNRAIGAALAIGLATGTGAVAVYARTEVHDRAIARVEPMVERMAAIEMAAATKADVARDLATVQASIGSRLDTLSGDLRALSDRLARREGAVR